MSKSFEWSAGGVLVREHEGVRELAVIRPRRKAVLCLPKGHIDEGETPEGAAVREVREETGLTGVRVADLGDVNYEYRFRGRNIQKRVTFFLLRYQEGIIDALDPAMRKEVDRAFWIPLIDAVRRLAYPGEKSMVEKAIDILRGEELQVKAPHP